MLKILHSGVRRHARKVVRKTPTPNTLVLSTTGRNFNPGLKTEIEVRFIADGSERSKRPEIPSGPGVMKAGRSAHARSSDV